jgi:hypothetical protein
MLAIAKSTFQRRAGLPAAVAFIFASPKLVVIGLRPPLRS